VARDLLQRVRRGNELVEPELAERVVIGDRHFVLDPVAGEAESEARFDRGRARRVGLAPEA
jgi:hypothetical protein